jgi:hypothetical protein
MHYKQVSETGAVKNQCMLRDSNGRIGITAPVLQQNHPPSWTTQLPIIVDKKHQNQTCKYRFNRASESTDHLTTIRGRLQANGL